MNHSAAAELLVLELDASTLPVMERAYARDVATAGIDQHERAFLDEVRPVLMTEQWHALVEFEHASATNGRSAVLPEPATPRTR